MKKLSQDEFIKRCEEIHNNKYDYTLTKYIKDKTPINVICPKHGKFVQRCDHHMKGHGCKKCMGEQTKERLLSNTNEFIEKAKQIHGNRYSYDKSIYTKARNKIIVTCAKHGDFEAVADTHLNGVNCIKCATAENADKQRYGLNKIIKLANEVHNNRYDYSKANYKGYNKKIEIICLEHGSFFQNMTNHISGGKGCPECNVYSKSEKYIAKLLRFNNVKFQPQKTFDNFRNTISNRKYRYDFYIPTLNLLIEYDGQQHFKPIPIWRNNCLKRIQNIDKIKSQYCIDNNINLLRIRYDEKITEKLLKNKVIENVIPNHPLF